MVTVSPFDQINCRSGTLKRKFSFSCRNIFVRYQFRDFFGILRQFDLNGLSFAHRYQNPFAEAEHHISGGGKWFETGFR